jgi:hypothetical protein
MVIAGGVLAVVLGGGTVLAFASGMLSGGLNSGVCLVDGAVPADDAKSANATALRLVRAMVAGDTATAFAMMTPQAQTGTSKDTFAGFINGTNATVGPFRDPQVTHVLLIDSAGSGPDAGAICGPVGDDGMIVVGIKPGLRQAHVVVTAETQNNGWSFTVWLLPQDGGWRVQYVHMSMAAVAGHSGADILAMARRERDAGHIFNATLLYLGARQMADRGPDFQLQIAQTINGEIAALKPPEELKGALPFTWNMAGENYKVAQAGLIGIGKDIGLTFILPHDSWKGDEDADAGNRKFITAFRASHPDYARVFAFLVARAMKPDNSGGFGTVYDNAKGFH